VFGQSEYASISKTRSLD